MTGFSKRLRLSPNVTTEELSRLLNLTRADIRYHLKGTFAGLGRSSRCRSSHDLGGNPRGRPAKTYQLSASARPDVLAQLADILLTMIQAKAKQQPNLQGLADQLFPVPAVSAVETHLSQRLNAVIQMINQRPYQARWEAHAVGPLVFFHNCPFAPIIRQHPELCQVDRLSLENLTGMAARQTRKIDLDGPTSSFCVFQLSSLSSINQQNKTPA